MALAKLQESMVENVKTMERPHGAMRSVHAPRMSEGYQKLRPGSKRSSPSGHSGHSHPSLARNIPPRKHGALGEEPLKVSHTEAVLLRGCQTDLSICTFAFSSLFVRVRGRFHRARVANRELGSR